MNALSNIKIDEIFYYFFPLNTCWISWEKNVTMRLKQQNTSLARFMLGYMPPNRLIKILEVIEYPPMHNPLEIYYES
jgi:hypothetical protein